MATLPRYTTSVGKRFVTVDTGAGRNLNLPRSLWDKVVEDYNRNANSFSESLQKTRALLDDPDEMRRQGFNSRTLRNTINLLSAQASNNRPVDPENVSGSLNTTLTGNLLSEPYANIANEVNQLRDFTLQQKRAKEKSSGTGAVLKTVVPAGIAAIGGILGAQALSPVIQSSGLAGAPLQSPTSGQSVVGPLGAANVPSLQAGSIGNLVSGLNTASKIGSAVNTAQGLLSGSKTPQSRPDQPQKQMANLPTQSAEDTIERPQPMSRPGGMNELAGFSPIQERSFLATKGLNQGLGKQENDYYRNLLQRTLIGNGGQVKQSNDFLLPIESQYFSQQGSNTSDVYEFLRSIR